MLVEIQWSSSGNPPGETGMAPATPTLWARFGNGEWQRCRANKAQMKIVREIKKLLEIQEE